MGLKEVKQGMKELSLNELEEVRKTLRRQLYNKGRDMFEELKVGDRVKVVRKGEIQFKGEVTKKRRKNLLITEDETLKKYVVPPSLIRRAEDPK